MTAVPLALSVVSRLINLRGQIVTAINLRHCLDLEPRAEGSALTLGTGYDQVNTFSDKLNEDIELNSRAAQSATAESAKTYSSSKYWIVSLSMAAMVLDIIIAASIARAIAASTTKMLATIEQIAANNLAISDMEIRSNDEIGKAGLALNKMKNNLHGVIESISGTARRRFRPRKRSSI